MKKYLVLALLVSAIVGLIFTLFSAKFFQVNDGSKLEQPLKGRVIYSETKDSISKRFCSEQTIYQGAPFTFLSSHNVGCSEQKQVDYYFNLQNFIIDYVVNFILFLIPLYFLFKSQSHQQKTN